METRQAENAGPDGDLRPAAGNLVLFQDLRLFLLRSEPRPLNPDIQCTLQVELLELWQTASSIGAWRIISYW